ncbi:helix-turn-helix transcriptional regulator [Lactobacillus sp. YT155]|uniref:helix-turn-helix domain-containing protein n=1 Tax=Lactobacillus sp. YT155 TaxID=3060955 RepID=UPI00265D726E|nr:helix-turn-helix transcriptional regulator [Lactobacillus sp. YT155]MDO1604857.1 helix-turn-helix transcriptional regulator [Lactobacillus sp. YT155]
MTYNKKAIAERLKKIRTDNNLSMQEFSELIGVSGKSTINEWEKARSIPSKKTLIKIASTLQVDSNFILYGNFADYIKELVVSTIKERNDEDLVPIFLDYLTQIDALSQFKDYENSQEVNSIYDQIRIRETVLNMAIEKTLDDNIAELNDFLYEKGISFSSSKSLILKTITLYYLKRLNKANLTTNTYIHELIAATDPAIYDLGDLSGEDSNKITDAITNFHSQLEQILTK